MSSEDLEKFRSLLEKEKGWLEEKLKKLSHVDFGDDVDSGEEESDEVEELATNIASMNVLRDRLRGIEKALKKIDDGTYGACEKCGGKISLKILGVNPDSKLCKNCKKRHG